MARRQNCGQRCDERATRLHAHKIRVYPQSPLIVVPNMLCCIGCSGSACVPMSCYVTPWFDMGSTCPAAHGFRFYITNLQVSEHRSFWSVCSVQCKTLERQSYRAAVSKDFPTSTKSDAAGASRNATPSHSRTRFLHLVISIARCLLQLGTAFVGRNPTSSTQSCANGLAVAWMGRRRQPVSCYSNNAALACTAGVRCWLWFGPGADTRRDTVLTVLAAPASRLRRRRRP